jgi:hypothetical protein
MKNNIYIKNCKKGFILVLTLFVSLLIAASSYVNINAVRLSVDDNKIDSGIANDGDIKAVVGGDSLTDRVSFLNSWGGNGQSKKNEK